LLLVVVAVAMVVLVVVLEGIGPMFRGKILVEVRLRRPR